MPFSTESNQCFLEKWIILGLDKESMSGDWSFFCVLKVRKCSKNDETPQKYAKS
jgi:hypothetical protein